MSRLPQITAYACYYGQHRLDALSRFPLVILQPDDYTRRDIAFLRRCGTFCLAYLSLGETPGYEPAASWYLRDADGTPLVDADWPTYYVDTRDPAWQQHVLKVQIPLLRKKWFNGLFLDTLDTQERYPDIRGGTIALVHAIRKAIPRAILIANRGFTILDQIAADLDAVMFESFSTYHRAGNYGAWEGNDLDVTTSQAHWLNYLRLTYPFQVLALDYAPPRSLRLPRHAAQRARAFGFIPYVTNANLTDLRRAP
jgi:hypothetical protein